MSIVDAGTTCDQCTRDITGRVVTLQLDGGAVKQFCDDACERRWTIAEIIRLRRFARRIYILSRGRARKLAHTALTTDTQP